MGYKEMKKNQIRRILAMFCVLTMLFGNLPVTALAEMPVSEQNQLDIPSAVPAQSEERVPSAETSQQQETIPSNITVESAPVAVPEAPAEAVPPTQ